MNDNDRSGLSVEACHSRGRMLMERDRPADAADWFKQALSVDPNHAPSYSQLALCWVQQDATKTQGLDAARRAVALEPENSFYRGILALVMAAQAKDGQNGPLRDALSEAEQGLALDPDSSFVHGIKSLLLLRLRRYPEAEAAAKHTLSLDIDNTTANEVLSAALLSQGKDQQNRTLIDYQLENNPENASAHVSKGMLALHQGRHREANQHFVEALRLEPSSEVARIGLIESFRARNFFYRSHLRFSHWLSRLSEGRQSLFFIVAFLMYRMGLRMLKGISPLAAGILVAAWMVLVFWSHLARGIGGFFMVWDRYARLSLRPRELWEGIIVGSLALLAPVLLLCGYARGKMADEFELAAAACFLGAIPWAAAFTNDHHVGKYIYWSLAAIAGLGTVLALLALIIPGFTLGVLGALAAVLIGAIMSWVVSLRVLYA
jgi:tetratricopeptide (TPR) repeat protein